MLTTSLKTARDFLNDPQHDVGFPDHEELCKECPGIMDPACLRCRIEVVVSAYGAFLGAPIE